MKKTFLAVAIVAVSLVVILCLSIDGGDCQEKKPGRKHHELTLNLSPQVLWANEIKYAMQWDDTSKKLLFNGRAASHATATMVYREYGRVRITDPGDDDAPAYEYSFDVEGVGDTGVSSDFGNKDGQLQYNIQWNDAKEQFMYPGRAPESIEFFQFCTSFPR